jgi:hypothetical protein
LRAPNKLSESDERQNLIAGSEMYEIAHSRQMAPRRDQDHVADLGEALEYMRPRSQ